MNGSPKRGSRWKRCALNSSVALRTSRTNAIRSNTDRNLGDCHLFTFPKKDFCKKKFMSTTLSCKHDQATGIDDAAKGVNELGCRRFLFNLILGQILDRASDFADQAYESVMMRIFDAVGKWFHMDGRCLFEELDAFSTSEEAKNEDALLTLKSFLTRKNFVDMYVGCVLSEAVPLLYCTLLPTIWDQKREKDGKAGDITSERYKQHLEHVQEILKS